MEAHEHISSRQNPRIKHLVKLRDRAYRVRSRQFLVEGAHELAMALRHHAPLEQIYYCDALLQPAAKAMLDEAITSAEKTEATETTEAIKAAEMAVATEAAETANTTDTAEVSETATNVLKWVRVDRPVFEKISLRDSPDGLLGVATLIEPSLDAVQLSASPLLLIAEGVEKPGNLGAMVRSAEAAGADAMIIIGERADRCNPNLIRNSRGLVFALPVVTTTRDALLKWLTTNGITLFAATPDAESAYWDVDLRGPVALLMGTEHEGLSADWSAEAFRRLSIPMAGQADSLNVAASAAILLFESRRQRQQAARHHG